MMLNVELEKDIKYLTRLCEDIEQRLVRLESRFVRIAMSEGYDLYGNKKEDTHDNNTTHR